MIAVRQVSLDGRNDRVFTRGEDSHALRLESELSDLQAVNANLRCFATRIELTHYSDKKDLTMGARSCLVGVFITDLILWRYAKRSKHIPEQPKKSVFIRLF